MPGKCKMGSVFGVRWPSGFNRTILSCNLQHTNSDTVALSCEMYTCFSHLESLSPAPSNHKICFLSLQNFLFWIFYEWNHIVCGFLCLASLQNIFKVSPCHGICQDFRPFYGIFDGLPFCGLVN